VIYRPGKLSLRDWSFSVFFPRDILGTSPSLKPYSGHCSTGHSSTSLSEPPLQSRHFRRMARIAFILSCMSLLSGCIIPPCGDPFTPQLSWSIFTLKCLLNDGQSPAKRIHLFTVALLQFRTAFCTSSKKQLPPKVVASSFLTAATKKVQKLSFPEQ